MKLICKELTLGFEGHHKGMFVSLSNVSLLSFSMFFFFFFFFSSFVVSGDIDV